VDGYLNKNDNTISDVLKKIPGIEVKDNGQIYHNNEPINKFYIEGLDMLQGRYGVATNSIRAKDVATVQVLENHQPIKAMKNKILSEQSAINLKLKESAKGVITIHALLGLGFKPLLWNAELNGMNFSKKQQNITVFKGNNSGDNTSENSRSFYSNDAMSMSFSGLLGLVSPASPAINSRRHSFNLANTVSFNNLWKLKNDYQLNVNLNYNNDRQDKSSYSLTENYLPNDSILRIEENLNSRFFMNQGDLDFQINKNADKFYLNNVLKISASWNRERGSAFGRDSVEQRLNRPYYGVNNTFRLVKSGKRNFWNLYSFNGYTAIPQDLTVQPVLYPSLFETGHELEKIRQETDARNFASYTKFSTGADNGTLKQQYSAEFRADLQNLSSALKAITPSGTRLPSADSLRNDLQWNKFELRADAYYAYTKRRLNASLTLPVRYMMLNINDDIPHEIRNNKRVYLNPSLYVSYKISPYWETSLSASLSNQTGGISREYSGYIMTDYRHLIRNDAALLEQQNRTCTWRLNYKNPVKSLFGYVHASYFNNRSNLLYGYDYRGILSVQTSNAISNNLYGYQLSASVNKEIEALKATLFLSGKYSISNGSQLTQGEIVDYTGENYTITPRLLGKLGVWATYEYKIDFTEHKNKVKNNVSDYAPIRRTQQAATLSFFPVNGFTVTLTYENFYNSAISSGSKNISFGDVGLRYKVKNYEFLIDFTNVFNEKTYVNASYSSINAYYYACELRPAEIMFKLRLKLK
jgi:hypothetical protein